ncbi:MAG TPA: hypothetical protein PKK68_06785 [Methanothrix soehngenii]|jgi:hypothetical protein|nr:hypothetical protein [Methanothrix soehngenii]
MIDLGENEIRQLCSESSFSRGEMYFEEGRVSIKETTLTRIKAVVSGTEDYHVEIEFGEELSGECDCPYDWGGMCKHIVAVLLAVVRDEDKTKDLIEESNQEREEIKKLLKMADADDLRSFLLSEMEQQADLLNRFKVVFGKSRSEFSVDAYKSDVELLYEDVEHHGYVPYGENVDFSTLTDLAELHILKGDHLEAAKIYQAVSETIAEKMDEVDDSDGNYGEEFSSSMDAFADCIIQAGLDVDGKRPYIKYLFNKYWENDPDYFQSDYEDALNKICCDEQSLRYWKDLLDPHLPDEIASDKDWMRHHVAMGLISMKLDLCLKLREIDEFYGIIDRHFRIDARLCLRYARRLLSDGKKEKAQEVAEEGLATFKGHSARELRDFLCGIYIDSDPRKNRDTLHSLFIDSNEWQYYERLRKACSPEEWQERLERILDYYSVDKSRDWYGGSTLVDIHIREKMHDKALELVLSKNSLNALRHYHNDLSSMNPERYFDAYRKLIVPFAGKETGRKHYQMVVSYLKLMKRIDGHEKAVSEIVGQLRIEHRKKPAFIDEMKEL